MKFRVSLKADIPAKHSIVVEAIDHKHAAHLAIGKVMGDALNIEWEVGYLDRSTIRVVTIGHPLQ